MHLFTPPAVAAPELSFATLDAAEQVEQGLVAMLSQVRGLTGPLCQLLQSNELTPAERDDFGRAIPALTEVVNQLETLTVCFAPFLARTCCDRIIADQEACDPDEPPF